MPVQKVFQQGPEPVVLSDAQLAQELADSFLSALAIVEGPRRFDILKYHQYVPGSSTLSPP
jgi:hypothetical protein